MEDADAMVELFQPANEVEARELQSLLEQAGIDCKLAPSGETPYPSVGLTPTTWGRLLVPAALQDKAEALVADYLESEPEPVGERWRETPKDGQAAVTSRSVASLGRVAMAGGLVLSLAVNVLLWARLTGLETTTDADGRVMWEVIPGDNFTFPYEVRAFDAAGRHRTSWFDEDDNGRPERAIDFHADRPVMRSYDADQDGSFETSVIYRGETMVLEMRDENEDGLIETAGVPRDDRGDALAPPLFRDDDGDGRYDLIECDRQSRRVRFDVRSCAESAVP